jgi:hypothetical protein
VDPPELAAEEAAPPEVMFVVDRPLAAGGIAVGTDPVGVALDPFDLPRFCWE